MSAMSHLLNTRSILATSGAAGAAVTLILAVMGATSTSAGDKYSVRIPGGLSFSEFKGFEDWPTVSVSQTENLIEVILANPKMIAAYRAGVPGNGKSFPDGSKMAKIHWKTKTSADAPAPTVVPDTLHDVDVMVRDSKRFSRTGNWGYAQFDYDTASDTFKPNGTGTGCGHACHTIAASKDYVFTDYGKR
jgi:Cytochrome P460